MSPILSERADDRARVGPTGSEPLMRDGSAEAALQFRLISIINLRKAPRTVRRRVKSAEYSNQVPRLSGHEQRIMRYYGGNTSESRERVLRSLGEPLNQREFAPGRAAGV
jgi:hypothetical protein